MSSMALVIGINEYPADTKLKALEGAVADAADFADWALDPTGGNVPPENMYFWTHPAPIAPEPNLAQFLQNPNPWPFVGPDFNAAPEAMQIIRCVGRLAERCVDEDIERMYVFFAGHGAQTRPEDVTRDPQNCFIAGNFAMDMPAMGLVGCDDLRRYLVKFGPTELIMFFDCCREVLSVKVGIPATPYNNENNLGYHKRLGIGRAAQDACVAYEIPATAEGPARGAFSKLLVGGLRVHRVNGKLTLSDLESYVSTAIGGLMTPPNSQYPDFIERPKPPALILAEGAPIGGNIEVRLKFTSLLPGTAFELRDELDMLISTANVAPNGNIFTLPFGAYSVNAVGDKVGITFSHLGPGASDVTL
ncbi:caspase family protein [Rhizobium sp. X9]|uniref:caspase family protein n=1 Tax=Rhizobium sp. X9 TaxID=2815360 RepID=UPI001C0E347C|nr:caspase family protein [Rhizobium sp. X9]